jgi:hypothetical protein
VDLSKLVTGIKVESAYLPTIDIRDPFRPGAPSPVLQRLRPKITLSMGAGLDPVVVKPYGEPGPTKWPALAALLAVGAGFAMVGVWRAMR